MMKKRKRQIIQAARTLFLKNGFTNTSILDIIAAANISKGTFYNYFSTKNECLIAIIEETREEVLNRRYEIAQNEDPANIDILIKQIAILIQANQKSDLIQLFDSHSSHSDQQIKKVFENILIVETDWLANRFVDIYGDSVREIAFECATLTFGVLFQCLKVVYVATGKLDAPETVIQTILRHISTMIPSIKKEQPLITQDIVYTLQNKIHHQSISKVEILTQLEGFVENLSKNDPEDGIELANYLLKELQSSEEKVYVLQSILNAFSKAFENTSHKAEVHEISIALWEYLHRQRKKD